MQGQHACGSRVIVLQKLLSLCHKPSTLPAKNNGFKEGLISLPPGSADLSLLELYLWRQLKAHVCSVPIHNVQTPNQRNVNTCRTTRKYCGAFERFRRCVIRRPQTCIQYHGGNYEHSL